MKKHLLLFALVLSFFTALTQAAVVDTNNVAASVNTSGSLFRATAGMAGFEFPKGSDLHTIFASSLWLGGITPDGQLKLAAGMYGNEQGDFYTGPLTVDGNATTTAETMTAYDQVFLANAADISLHLVYLESLFNGTFEEDFPDGYTIPEWFFEWPAMGNPAQGQAQFLAPFKDYNEDLVYDPESGDYPLFPGDECAYVILNDRGGVHLQSLGEPLGVEIHCFIYSFNDELNEALNNSVFVRYEIINRSSSTYNDVYAGIWSDLDIGTGLDDYIGSHVEQAAYYAYNGDTFDEASISSGGYGETPPIQTVAVLSGPLMPANESDDSLPVELSSYETYGPYGQGFGDGVMDNERLGLSCFLYHRSGSNPISGEPTIAPNFYNFLKGIWKDGQMMSYGGDGVNAASPEPITAKYMFPGSSDPLFIGTEGVETGPWSEATAGNASGDRRGVGAIGPFILEPGGHQTIDIVYSSIASPEVTIEIDELVGEHIGGLKQYFFNDVYSDIPSLGVTVGVEEQIAAQSTLLLYPNPAVDNVSITHPSKSQIQVFATDGRLVAQWFAAGKTSQFDVSPLESGMYMVVSISEGATRSTVLVRE